MIHRVADQVRNCKVGNRNITLDMVRHIRAGKRARTHHIVCFNCGKVSHRTMPKRPWPFRIFVEVGVAYRNCVYATFFKHAFHHLWKPLTRTWTLLLNKVWFYGEKSCILSFS